MSASPPVFEVVGDGEISDAAIEALARLLLDVADRAESRDMPPTQALATDSSAVKGKRRAQLHSTEAQRPAK